MINRALYNAAAFHTCAKTQIGLHKGMELERQTQIARQFIEAIPHSRELGMVLEQVQDGMAQITMPYDTRLVGDPETGVIHGGAVSALLDTCCGAAVMSHRSQPIALRPWICASTTCGPPRQGRRSPLGRTAIT